MTGLILDCDQGNSSCKWRLSDSGKIVASGRAFAENDFVDLPEVRGAGRVRVASVAGYEMVERLAAALEKKGGTPEWAVVEQCVAGVSNAYGKDYAKLGVDRWLAVVAAYRHVAGAALVLDAGSALTADLVDDSGGHRGGYILPGAAMMQACLLQDTAQVRFEASSLGAGLGFGCSTADAVSSGVMAAQVGAAKVAIEQAGEQIPPGFAILVTGGNGEALLQHLPHRAEWIPDLVLDGLAWVLP